MINFDGKEMQNEFNKAFRDLVNESTGDDLNILTLTPAQLWWLVKFSKHVRGRCRTNTAFNNYMNRNFPNARFQEIPKEYNGKQYMGLKITVNGESLEGDES